MKKKVFLIPLAMFMVTGTVGLAACDTVERDEPAQPSDDTKTLVGIAVDTPPTKTVYTDGDNFDPTGLKIKASYTDGTSEIVDGWTVDKTKLAVGDNVVTISYTKGTVTLTTTVAITVNPKVDPGTKTLTGIAVTTQPTKTHYDVGEVFDKAGMVVTASYSNTDTADVTEHVTTDKDGVPLTADDKVITVSYTEGELTFTAKVNITVGGEPTPPGPEHAGTLEDPLTTAEAATIANGLAETTDSKNPIASEGMYVKGVVTEFKETFSADYGNYSIVIGGDFTLWRIKNGPEFAKFNEGDIEVGDEVTAFVYIMNFKGTPESTSNSYVHSVQKAGDTKTLQSIEIVGSLTKTSYVEGQTYSSAGLSVKGHYDDGSEGTVAATITLNKTTAALGDTEIIASATFKEITAEPMTFAVTVTEKVPVVGGAVYTFTNDKEDTQNMGTWTSDQFMNHISVEGAEIITGMKGVTNAYIGGNGGSGDGAWNIWNCLKVGKSSAKGEITLLLDGTANFEKIKVSAIGARDDGTLTINDITKNVTKKAIKTDLNPIELEYEIAGGVTELKLSSKDAASNNYGICITRIEFVGEAAPVTLESITADMTNKEYTAGQALSLAGLTVTGHYSNGTTAVITEGIETSMAEGKILETTDTKLVVSVGELDCEIPLTVRAADVTLVSISLSGVKESYYAGDLLGEVVVTAHYSDESSSTVSAELKIGDAVVDATHVMALGESKLVATYQGENAEAEFTVVEDTVVSIAVSSEHRSFNVDEEFVKETITATHLSGKTSDVTNEASFSSVDMSTAGEKEITVTYGELTPIKYTITVTKLVVFEKATDIAVGDIVALVNEDAKKEMTSVTDIGVVSDYTNNITHSFELEVVAGSQTNTFAFKNGDKYLNFTGTSNKLYLNAESVTDESSWTVEFSDGNVTIKNVAASTRFIQYNASQPRFACYTNAQKSVQLYKAPADPAVLQEIVVSTNNHREFYLNSEFVPETIMAKYDKGADVDVTDKAVFEDYDMKTAGEQTVKVSYGGKETSYSITVLSAPAPVVDVTGVSLNETELDLVVDEEATLVATVAPADASNKNVTWLSDNESVATVVDGVVTAVGEGEATITVTTVDQGKTATCAVTVSPKPTPTGDTTLDFTQIEGFSEWTNSYSQHIVEYTDVIVTFDGASKQGSTISNMPVGKDAPVTIVAKEGKNLNYFSAEFAKWNTNNQTVNVEYSTDFGKTFVSLGVSTTTFAIEKTNLPKGTSAIRFKPVDSKQIGYSKVVTNIISAQTPDPVAVTGVSLDNTELTLGPTKSEQLVATVAPINATNKNVVWSVIEGDEFVSVDQTGVVTGLKVGEGIVQVATADGNFKATCTVTVSDDAPTTKEATLDLTGSKASWDPQTVKKDESASYTVGEFVFTAYGGSASTASTAGYSESYRTYSGSYVEISLPTNSKYASFASMTMNVGSKDGSTSGGYKISADTIDDVSGTIKAAATSPAEVVVEKLNGATIIRIACTSGQLRYVSFNFVMNLK